MKRNLAFLAVSAALLAAGARPARADSAMTFSHLYDRSGIRWGQGARDYIFADGEITASTPAALSAALAKYHAHPGFILVLNSPGGDLHAGMVMGRLIRQAGLWTEIGSEYPMALGLNPNLNASLFPYLQTPGHAPFPGYCYSSCTFAFLGGVVRIVNYTSDYGVHRFYFSGSGRPEGIRVSTEMEMARIEHYLKEMGVDPDFATKMVLKGREHVSHLSERQMEQLGIVTPFWQTTWDIRQGDGLFYYYGDTTSVNGHHDHAQLYCALPEQRAKGYDVMLNLFVDPAGEVSPASFTAGVEAYNLRLDNDGLVFSNHNRLIWRPAFVDGSTGRIGVILGFKLKQFTQVMDSHYLGFMFFNPRGEVNYLGATMTLGRKRLLSFAQHCMPRANTDFTLSNLSASVPLSQLSYRPAGSGQFTALLGHPLAAGQSAKITMPHYQGCAFDMIGRFANQAGVGWRNVDLCVYGKINAFAPAAGPAGAAGTVTVANGGKAQIVGLNISPHSSRSWGANLLAGANHDQQQALAPGASRAFEVPLNRTCQYDIRVLYDSRHSEARMNLNLCRIGTITFAAPALK